MPRITVTLTDKMKRELEAYADEHGATTSAALVALASRQLTQDREAREQLLMERMSDPDWVPGFGPVPGSSLPR